MAKRLRVLGGILLVGCGIGAVEASCSSPGSQEPEPVGQGAAALALVDAGDSGAGPSTPGPLSLTVNTNFQVTQGNVVAGYPGYHETTIAKATHSTSNGLVANWVMGFNVGPDNTIGWAYSTNLDASSWTKNYDSGTAFGDPCSGGNCMSDEAGFLGMGGDPSMATVTDPDASTSSGQRVLYVQLANSTSTGHGTGNCLGYPSGADYTDIAVAISDNGGHSFGHPQLLTTPSTGAPAGCGVDNATIASHLASPYSTYAAWSVGGSGNPGGGNSGYITQVYYDSSFNFGALTPASKAKIPGNQNVYHPAVAVGQWTNCLNGNSTDEMVYVTWADNVNGTGCPNDAGAPAYVNWWLAAYDTTAGGVWYGPWKVDTDSSWAGCVGGDGGVIPSGAGRDNYDNDVRPRITVEPSNNLFWIAYIKSTLRYGTRLTLAEGQLGCSQNVVVPTWSTWNPSTKCWDQNGCTNSPGDGGPPYNNITDNGYTVNDEWGPAIAFIRNPNTSTRELVATWYDTREDQYNIKVNMMGASSVGFSTTAFPMSDPPSYVGANSGTPTGQNVPWDHTRAPWWDYQAVAAEDVTYTFLAAWGGDARLCVNSPCTNGSAGKAGIWSAIVK